MPDFNVRSDSVNVEQIMEQIRARILEKRGVDYTEQQIRELAAVKLEKFLDPSVLRSDLVSQFQRQAPVTLPNYAFEEHTLFESHRGMIRWFRKLFQPILKLFFNPNPLIQALHIQAQLNTYHAEYEQSHEALYYELIHNLVIEITRLGIEVKNLKMRTESLTSRLEFNERRGRALEGAVLYRPDADEHDGPIPTRAAAKAPAFEPMPAPIAAPGASSNAAPAAAPVTGGAPAAPGSTPAEGPGQRSRRRRRRRGRRGGAPASAIMGGTPSTAPDANAAAEATTDHDDLPGDDGGADDHEPEAAPSTPSGQGGSGDEQ